MQVSERIGRIEYAIRDVQLLANKLIEKGHDVIQFNIGDPIKFDFEVPDVMQNALIKYKSDGYYSESIGDKFVRDKIANYERNKQGIDINSSDIIYFQGVSEGIFFTFFSFLNPGDRILVPGPSYPAYKSVGEAADAEVVAYRCIEEEDWIPDVDDIRSKLTNKTKIVVLINPNNPTGAVYSERILREIRDLVGETDAVIMSDEIYDQLVFEGNYKSFSSIAADVPAVIFNGFSKIFLAPGWRAAYGFKLDNHDKLENVWEGVKKLCRIRLSPNTPISKAAVMGLTKDPPHLFDVKRKLKERRDLVIKRLNEIDRITTTTPKAAFYIFPKLNLDATKWKNDKEFVLEFLNEKKTLLVHGSGFGREFGQDHFRLVYLAPPQIINTGLQRLKEFYI